MFAFITQHKNFQALMSLVIIEFRLLFSTFKTAKLTISMVLQKAKTPEKIFLE